MKSEYLSSIITNAIASVVSDQIDMEYYERKIRRAFSEKFHTPLYETFKIPFDEILTHVFESRFEQLKASSNEDDEDQLWREVNVAINPNYDHDLEKSNQEFADMIVERDRQKKNDKMNLDAATAQLRALNKQVNTKYSQPTIDTKTAKSLNNTQPFTMEPSSLVPKGNQRRFEDEGPPPEL